MCLAINPLQSAKYQKSFLKLILLWIGVLAFNFLFAQSDPRPAIQIPNPTLPNYNPPNPLQGIRFSGYNHEEAQRRQIQEVDEYIKRNDPMMRKIYYPEPKVTEVKGRSRIQYNYPANYSYGKIHFDKAYKEISDMIEGRKPYSLKRAVFLTEYAYDTTLNYAQFERQIAKLVEIIGLEMKQKNIRQDDNLGKIMAVFRFMADTIKVRNPVLEKTITTYPKTYDFEDFYGMRDYRKMFVSKLIRTGKGNCHSLPLLYLILCQEINAEAYLSFSPQHCYVKFEDNNGTLHNMELTNQMFTTDQFIVQSGYVTSASVKNKIYMDTLGMKRIVSHTLNDLANNYVKKYGYDDFVMQCASTLASKDTTSIHAYMHIANYYNISTHGVEKQYEALKVPRELYFNNDEDFRNIVRNAIQYGQLIDNLGYAEMPPEMYSKWLNSLKDESMRQQHLERKRILSTMTEF